MNIKKRISKHVSRETVNRAAGLLRFVPDKSYLRCAYRLRLKKKLRLDQPLTFSEKIQWLKLHDRRLEYTIMVDKYEVKEYVASIIGAEHVIPTLGVWDRFEDIDFDALPDSFVLKCTHDSGGLVICKDKKKLDLKAARKKINRSLRTNYYWVWREWPYKDVKPRVIAEPYLEDSADRELKDYKFFTFDGKAKALFIASDRADESTETHFDFFDMDFNHLDMENGHPNAGHGLKKPKTFEQMKECAEKLGRGLPHVRVDFYEVDGKMYFGELTFYHWAGMKPFKPEKWDEVFGSWLTLPKARS